MSSGEVTSALKGAPWRFLLSRWPWLSLGYLAISAALGIGLLLLLVFALLLLPLWALAVGALERRRARLLGYPLQPTGHVRVDGEERHHWLGIRLTEAATWREALALLIDLVAGMGVFVLLAVEVAGVALLAAIAVAGLRGPTELQLIGDLSAVITPANWWPAIPIGLVGLCVLAYLNAALATAQAAALRPLCGPRQHELDQNVQRLLRSRRSVAEAAEAERRRIERDLHDGAQQQLIVLGARLGMVTLELEDLASRGVELSGALGAVDAAQAQAERAMAALRDTVRGIHPSVLTDHGLGAALEELAERHPASVTLDLAPDAQLPPVVETTTYYLVSEALTNVARHATATAVGVRTRLVDGAFVVTVSDDGSGGARERPGAGLSGLRERAEALNGRFRLDSPPGGPTVLRMELPLTEQTATGGQAADAHSAG